MKKFNFENKRMNLKTKIFVFLFFLLAGLYLVDKFFDNYTFVSPIKKLEWQWIIQPRNTRKTTKKAVILKKMINDTEKTKKPQETAKFGQILASSKEDETSDGEKAIYVYFGDDKMAYAVARAESGLNCKAVGDNGCSIGLFQINKVHMWRFAKFGGNPLNCWDNAKVAREIYEEQGWRPWSVYLNKSYLKFLN